MAIQTNGGAPDLARAEGRLPRWMMAWGAVGVIAGFVFAGPRFAAGLAVGAALAILNYSWLHQAIAALLRGGHTRVPRLVVAKFAVRYPLAIAALYLLYKTDGLPFTAILAGLFVPVAGVLAEAIVQICTGWREA